MHARGRQRESHQPQGPVRGGVVRPLAQVCGLTGKIIEADGKIVEVFDVRLDARRRGKIAPGAQVERQATLKIGDKPRFVDLYLLRKGDVDIKPAERDEILGGYTRAGHAHGHGRGHAHGHGHPKPTLLCRTLPRINPNGVAMMHVRPVAAPMPHMRFPWWLT